MATPLVAPLTPVKSNDVAKTSKDQGHKAVIEATKDGSCPMPLTSKANSHVQSRLPDVVEISSNTLHGHDLGGVMGQYPDDSDSEGEEKLVAETPTHSERKRIQDALFKSYVSTRAAQATKEEVQAILKDANEETLSVRGLIARQDSSVIITDPREYQLELFEKAKKQNIIAVLDTGSGKTLIAVLLLRYILDQELEDRAIGIKRRMSFFLLSEPCQNPHTFGY
ncbi:hypothetical protein N7G274_003011 [Stereocaulon virgatum]|uniref:Dicer-like protein 1 n=1 Tax=Stereocaulon virgatum TaxID=373712 RepID=A0ABR4AFL1_9LECA